MTITRVPVLLGAGIPLFTQLSEALTFEHQKISKLIASIAYKTLCESAKVKHTCVSYFAIGNKSEVPKGKIFEAYKQLKNLHIFLAHHQFYQINY